MGEEAGAEGPDIGAGVHDDVEHAHVVVLNEVDGVVEPNILNPDAHFSGVQVIDRMAAGGVKLQASNGFLDKGDRHLLPHDVPDYRGDSERNNREA